MRVIRFVVVLVLASVAAYYAWMYRPVSPVPWTDASKATLRSLWIESLPPLEADPSNRVADNDHAVIMGNRLFFDTRMSASGGISCATCHQPDLEFTDGLSRGRGIGESKRNTRSIVGVAHSPWFYWDGRRDSLWSQALSPLEDPDEHGSDRLSLVRFVTTEPTYRQMYEALFGPVPDISDAGRFPAAAAPGLDSTRSNAWSGMDDNDKLIVNTAFANIGKAIAAYERTILHEPTRFDAYVKAVLDEDEIVQSEMLSKDEILGLQLYIGKARCTECHNGPLFTNHEFHNTGVISAPGELPDRGRIDGVREVLEQEFNCLGPHNDDPDPDCAELKFVRTGTDLLGATRTPSLRNISRTSPYMHKGQLQTLREVLEHYNEAPDALIGHNEAEPLGLSRPELRRLEAFLGTLAAPLP